jgi:hypothetical protein
MVSRECLYYINLRQAYLLSPFYANRLSSRTVLYTNVPRSYLDEDRIRWILGNSVKRVWIPQSTRELDDLVKEREQTAMRLEKAEFALIKMATAARNQALKSQEGSGKEPLPPSLPQLDFESSLDDATTEADSPSSMSKSVKFSEDSKPLPKPTNANEKTLPDVNGSVAGQWISHSSRPHHRPIANYGRRVDTIKWTRIQIKKLNFRISKARRESFFNPKSVMPSVFVEFETHTDAQNAYQTLTHHRPLHMSQRYLGVRPFEIVWRCLSMSWWEAIVRKFGIMALITAMIIFWSIPSALVGTISNIEYLSTKIFFLHWINKLPSAIKGVLSGIVPALALSLLMSIVPGILRSRFDDTAVNFFLLTQARLCQSFRNSDLEPHRAIRAECVFCLPGRPSIPNHDLDLGGIGCHHEDPRGSDHRRVLALTKSAQGLELLPVVFSCAEYGHWCCRPLPGFQLVQIHHPATVLCGPEKGLSQISPVATNSLGGDFSCVH